MTDTTEKTPGWLLPVLSFIVGVAITAGTLLPSRLSPDYRRAYDEGYEAGFSRNSKKLSEVSFENTQLRAKLQGLK